MDINGPSLTAIAIILSDYWAGVNLSRSHRLQAIFLIKKKSS